MRKIILNEYGDKVYLEEDGRYTLIPDYTGQTFSDYLQRRGVKD